MSSREVYVPRWCFADRLRKVRTDRAELTQERFAEVLGYGRSRYGAWEDGRNVPRDALMWEIAVKIRELYGVPTEWMVAS